MLIRAEETTVLLNLPGSRGSAPAPRACTGLTRGLCPVTGSREANYCSCKWAENLAHIMTFYIF
jgi:hypothetical protein